MRHNYILMLFGLILFSSVLTSCTDDMTDTRQGKGTLTLKLDIPQSFEVSRAETTATTAEKQIDNLFVMVFDAGTRRLTRAQGFTNVHAVSVADLTYGAKIIVGIANYGKSAESTTISAGSLETLDDLENLLVQTSTLKRAAGDFVMVGQVATEFSSSNQTATLTLRRANARINVHVQGGNHVTARLVSWQVKRLPMKAPLVKAGEVDKWGADDYFDSGLQTVEYGDRSNAFHFYTLENRVSPLKIATTYQDRERRREGAGFINARPTATYMEVNMQVDYWADGNYRPVAEADSPSHQVSAQVTYRVFLGENSQTDFNSYTTRRNHAYQYTLTVNSVDDIKTEIENTGKNGEHSGIDAIISLNRLYDFDATNDVKPVEFELNQFGNNKHLYWSVSTPFSTEAEGETARDYQWIYFRLGALNADQTAYINDFLPYPGDNMLETISGDTLTYLNGLSDRVSASIRTDKLLDIKQLTGLLNYINNHRGKAGLPENSKALQLFRNGKIKFVAYVRDYYYSSNPNGDGKAEIDLWRDFVNKPPRTLAFYSKLTSWETQSQVRSDAYTFRQRSIETMFNPNNGETDIAAWGTHFYQDLNAYPYSIDKNATTAPTTGEDGRMNQLNILKYFSGNPQWSDFVRISTNEVQRKTNNGTNDNANGLVRIAYACTKYNRDKNGDGKITQDEIDWYLATLPQLQYMWLGNNSFTHTLYPEGNTSTGYLYATSSIEGMTNGNMNLDARLYWADQGGAFQLISNQYNGQAAGNGKLLYFRCVRNLGGNAPQSPITVNTTNKQLDFSRINPWAFRSVNTVSPWHHLAEPSNYLWKRITYAGSNVNITVKSANGQYIITQGNCPQGYRLPNQRELMAMYLVKNDLLAGLSVAQTKISNGNLMAVDKRIEYGYNRPLSIPASSSGTVFSARCVKDVP